MEKFSELKFIDRNKITTDPKIFQGRQEPYSQSTVNKIVGEGYDKSEPPIVVWWDAQKKMYIVISGHSRWEASRILFERGDKSLAKMPAKEFYGDREAAADYAVLESNRSGTNEGFKSDLMAYKRAVNKGYNRQYLLGLFKPESYLNSLQKLSFLNENGLFLQYLGSEAEKSFPYLKRNSEWVGELRKNYPDLSDYHEKEMFNYLYSAKGIKVDKHKFLALIDKKVSRFDFNPEQALNLNEVVSSNAYTDPLKEKIKAIDKEIESLEKERSSKEELIIRAKNEGKKDLIDKFRARIKDINGIILRKIEEKKKIESQIANLDNNLLDLFSEQPEMKVKTKAKSTKRIAKSSQLRKNKEQRAEKKKAKVKKIRKTRTVKGRQLRAKTVKVKKAKEVRKTKAIKRLKKSAVKRKTRKPKKLNINQLTRKAKEIRERAGFITKTIRIKVPALTWQEAMKKASKAK